MQNEKFKDAKLYIILLQAATVLIILCCVFIIKQLDINLFNELKVWFQENFQVHTSVNEVLDDSHENIQSENFVLPENNEEFKERDEVVITNAVNLEKVKNISSFKLKTKNSLCVPVKKGFITSDFGGRPDPFTGTEDTHKGLDIAANTGDNIFSVCDGVVSEVGYDEYGYGKYIIIEHSKGFKTLYAHCNKIIAKEGESVKAGDVIAQVGSTGRSTGSHLHFEMRINDIAIDPKNFLGEL